MTLPARMTAALIALLSAPAVAQDAEAPDMTGAEEVAVLRCEGNVEGGASCDVDSEENFTFCMAVDPIGDPLANSTGATDAGVVLFQNVDPGRIAMLRCRRD